MQFRVWHEQQVEMMSISSLLITKSELFDAISNVYRGYRAQTEGPVEVAYMPQVGRYQLVNGYHRMVEFIVSGQDRVLVKINGEDTSHWRVPAANELFVYQPDMEYGGLEEIPGVEQYMLRNL